MTSPPPFADEDVRIAVRTLLGDPVKILSWRVEDVEWRVVSEVTGGLSRLRGLARRGGEDVPWSLVVKTSRPGEGDPPEDHGWRRE